MLSLLADQLPPALAGRLRVARHRRRERRYPRRVVEHRYGSRTLSVTIRSGYGERYDMDWPELAEIALLRQHGHREGARVFNLGANHGVIAMMLADAVGSAGQVIALEAGAGDADAARESAQRNGLVQLTVLHAAASRSSGTVDFGTGGEVDDGSGRFGRMPVQALSLPDLAARYGSPDVVFMDIEGFEGEVLAGAGDLLLEPIDWFVEVHGDEALGRYGSSVAKVLGSFDPERHALLTAEDRLVVMPESLTSLTKFAPFSGDPPSHGRFFLIALAR